MWNQTRQNRPNLPYREKGLPIKGENQKVNKGGTLGPGRGWQRRWWKRN
jgi:hypothetical protein